MNSKSHNWWKGEKAWYPTNDPYLPAITFFKELACHISKVFYKIKDHKRWKVLQMTLGSLKTISVEGWWSLFVKNQVFQRVVSSDYFDFVNKVRELFVMNCDRALFPGKIWFTSNWAKHLPQLCRFFSFQGIGTVDF